MYVILRTYNYTQAICISQSDKLFYRLDKHCFSILGNVIHSWYISMRVSTFNQANVMQLHTTTVQGTDISLHTAVNMSIQSSYRPSYIRNDQSEDHFIIVSMFSGVGAVLNFVLILFLRLNPRSLFTLGTGIHSAMYQRKIYRMSLHYHCTEAFIFTVSVRSFKQGGHTIVF